MNVAPAVVGVMLLLGACAGEAPTPRVVDPPSASAAGSATPTPSEALPDLCPPSRSLATPDKDSLPDLALNCLGSDDRRNLRHLGRPLVLNFWASWCGPCKVELPLLARAHHEYGDAISFIGVDVQDASAEAWKVLTATGVRYPQLEDPRGVTRGPLRWNAGLPITVFVDAQGRMVATERTSFRTYAEVTDALSRHLGTSPKDVNR